MISATAEREENFLGGAIPRRLPNSPEPLVDERRYVDAGAGTSKGFDKKLFRNNGPAAQSAEIDLRDAALSARQIAMISAGDVRLNLHAS
jgi:hypothetical protein